MKTLIILTSILTVWLAALPEASAGPLQQKITAANPASAEGARQVIALFHAELLRPAEDVSAEARGLCSRFLPTAIGGMSRGHVATCALQADAHEAHATCHWLAGRTKEARATLTGELALLDCPAQGVDGVDRASRLASDWLWPEAMEPIVRKQKTSLTSRGGNARAQKAADRNLALLTEARRRRRAATTAFGKGVPKGLLVLSTKPGSPASRAGLRKDDVLTLAGATPIAGTGQLRSALRKQNPSAITVYRRGKAVQLVWRGAFDGLEALPLPERLQSR
jgi:hypothetical protein